MDHLYVCLFSNGHVKVGRSNDPESRIAQHVDRVACMGVELISSEAFPCENAISSREHALIVRCAAAASQRFQNEWFDGLEFGAVCGWAREAAGMELEDVPQGESFGSRLREARKSAGLTQAELGSGLATDGGNLNKAAISTWEMDRCSPNVNQLGLICRRLGVSADLLLFGSFSRAVVHAAHFSPEAR